VISSKSFGRTSLALLVMQLRQEPLDPFAVRYLAHSAARS